MTTLTLTVGGILGFGCSAPSSSLAIGFQPAPFLERMEPSVQAVLERVEQTPSPSAMAETYTVAERSLDRESSEGVVEESSTPEDSDENLSHGDQE